MDNNLEICKFIQNNISKLCQTEIDEVFKILHKNQSQYTQNNNGVFVNLNWLGDDILQQIYDYISFCITSQSEINKYEIMKNMITDTIINRDKEDKYADNISNTSNYIVPNHFKQPKISSSMKFYLLKKKFQKRYLTTNGTNNNILTHEEYLIS